MSPEYPQLPLKAYKAYAEEAANKNLLRKVKSSVMDGALQSTEVL